MLWGPFGYSNSNSNLKNLPLKKIHRHTINNREPETHEGYLPDFFLDKHHMADILICIERAGQYMHMCIVKKYVPDIQSPNDTGSVNIN